MLIVMMRIKWTKEMYSEFNNGEEEGIDEKDDANTEDEEEEDLFSTIPAHESRQLRSLSRHTRENGSATFKTFNIIIIVIIIIILSSSSMVITNIIITVIIVFKTNKNLTLMIVTIMTQSRQMDTKVCLLLRKLPRNEMKACSGIKECPSV